MSATTEAITRGLLRGTQMAIYPDPTRLRELREAASSTDYTTEAWESVGEHLREAMAEMPTAPTSPPSR